MGFWSAFRQWLNGETPAPKVRPTPTPPAKKPAEPPNLTVLQGGLDRDTPFDQLLNWAGLNAPDRQVLTQADVDADEALAEKVLGHFRKNRPAPSSLPAVSLQVLNAVAEPNLSLADLTRLVAQDPALAAGILKVANSPAYLGAQEIQTLRDAVTRLGLTEVGRVAGMVAARSLFTPQLRSEFASLGQRWTDLFNESVTSARGAAWLALETRRGRSDHAFVAGMLHDLGRPVALRSIAALMLAGEKLDPHDQRIDRVLERVHVEVGGEVHQEWGLPRFPTLVAMRHHDLDMPTDGEYVDVHIVRLVSAMVQFRRQPWRVEQIRNEVNQSCQAVRLNAFQLRSLDTQLRDELAHVAASFTDKARRRTA